MPDVLYPDDLALPPSISASAYGPVVEVVIPLAPPTRDARLDAVEGRLDGLAVDDVDGLDTALAGKLDKSGGTLTGALVLAADPASAMQAVTKQYADGLIAAADAMVFKGVIDCSTNPNYPAADRGWTYRISVAGKIGGGSGPNVEAGDILLCLNDGTLAGNHAAAGANWSVIQVNIDGAVTLTGTQTLTNKTLASPVINSPSGLVKADVGLGSVDNTSDASKPISTAQAAALALRLRVDAAQSFDATQKGQGQDNLGGGETGKALFASADVADALAALGQTASLSASGHITLPGGLLIQWGEILSASTEFFLDYPIPFPTAVFALVGTPVSADSDGTDLYAVHSQRPSLTQGIFRTRRATDGGVVAAQGSLPIAWIAIGH